MSFFIEPRWQAPKELRVVTTTRADGISLPPYASNNLATHVGDEKKCVSHNRKNIQNLLGFHSFVTVQQVHGGTVATAQEAQAHTTTADAIYCRQKSLGCAILTADCLPIVIAGTNEYAVVHGGWRSLATGIIPTTVKLFATSTKELHVWIGPAICQSCYQVGDEVVASFQPFQNCFLRNNANLYCSLLGITRLQLLECGIQKISSCNMCTYEQAELFFSHRRDGVTGRMATIAWLA